MAAILIIFNLILSQILDQLITLNLDKFLHQQADNFKATMSIHDNRISFHDLNSDFEHDISEEEEIQFYLQMLDTKKQTVMLSGNLEGRRLYHGTSLPSKAIFETVFFFNKPSRRLITPLHLEDRNVGWLIVTVPYDYLDSFKRYINIVLSVSTLIGIVFFTFMSYGFVRLALVPVKNLTKQADLLVEQSRVDMLPEIGGDDEISALTLTLNHLLRKAGQSMETLELFAANVSHELKTPLALVHSEISLLQKKTNSKHQESYDLIAEEVDRMQTLIENLLVISHSKQPYKLSMTDIWLNDFISDEVGRLQRTFKHKKIHFDFSKIDSLKISTDIYLMQLVIDNILRNGMIYSPPNSTITISAHKVNDTVKIYIVDEGPGIPEADLNQIFMPFVRGTTSTEHVMKGSGLGLSISQWATDLLNGSLDLKNLETKGLSVTFSIPIQS